MDLRGRWNSPTFRRFVAIILVVEALTICASALLLNLGISGWIHSRTEHAIQVSRAAAATGGWDNVPDIRRGSDSPAFQFYEKKLSELSNKYVGNNTGEIYLVVLDRGNAYETYPDDPYPMHDLGKAPAWETEAYQTGRTTWNPTPRSDNGGTYLGAFTPIHVNGRIVGLVAAEFDTAPIADFQSVVRTAFWLSLLPAVIVALVVAYLLAGAFIEPMELFRKIEAVRGDATDRNKVFDPLECLTDREREIAALVRQGLSNKEIAGQIFVSPETVKQHLKNIREKTGFNKLDLAVHAEAGRLKAVLQGAS